MVLNPAWFNALVDDDGSGLTGTVWNKAVIKGLTDNIDIELNKSVYQQAYWTPGLTSSGGGTPAFTARTGFYGLVGKLCVAEFSMAFSKGSLAAGAVYIQLPFPGVGIGVTAGSVDLPWFSGLTIAVSRLGAVITSNAATAIMTYVAGAGGTTINYLDAGHFTTSCELKGVAAYLIA
jgi:hypothetical protein